MAVYFSIYKGDLLPVLEATLHDEVGVIDLTGATVRFQMRAPGTDVLEVDGAAAIVGSATAGVVRYTWATGDTDTVGVYLAWFQVTYLPKTLSAPSPAMIVEVTRR